MAIAWPPIGIFISAILLSRPKERPFIVVLLMVSDFAADLHTDISYLSMLIYAVLSTGDAVVSSWILLKFVANPFKLTKVKNLLSYVLFSVVLCNGFFSLLVASASYKILGSTFINGFFHSWVADGVGNLVIVPLLISWSSVSTFDLKQVKALKIIEIGILISLLFALNFILIPYFSDGMMFSFIINYLSFPCIIWAIFRFDLKVVTMILLLLTSVMLFNFMKNTDIFTSVSFNWNYIFFQLHIASISIISILITTVLNERNNAYNALLESENKYRTVADYTYAWEYWIDNEGNIRYMSPSVERITGYTAESFKLNPGLLDEIVFPDDREFWNNYKREILIDNCEKFKQIEFRILSKDNSIRWIGHDCRQIRSNGNSLGLRVSNRDITSLVEAERKLLVNSVEIEERERSRYSRELHDGLGPLLSTIKMYLQSLAETKDPARSKLITDESNNIVKTAIQTMREVAHGLSPFNLKNSGYVNALIDYIDGINKIQQISIDFKYNSNNRYPEFYEIILYRITTELINNTLKHANATSAGIVFSFNKSKKMISLIYNDNGKGFDTSGIKKSDKGIGLMNIMHRIKLLGGNIKIDSEAGKGMHVYIDFPLNEVVSLA